MNLGLLETLRARDAAAEEPEDEVRAMPVILRIERSQPPARTELLEAASAAALAVCMDERAEQGGPWHERLSAWAGLRIRKVARRARDSHWYAVQDCDGVTVAVGGAQARALVPDLLSQVAPEVRRLQISGTELAADTPGEAAPEHPLLWLNPTVPMTLGKAAAQVGHASMLLAAELHAAGRDETIAQWQQREFRCSVRAPTAERWALAVRARHAVAVQDAGFTEVDPGTVAALAFPP